MLVHHALPLPDFLARLLLGTCLGLLIGVERYLQGRPAGGHTAGLIAAGSALFASIQPASGESADRVIANIVTGVGFIAGGVILHQGANVTGLNTAATMWATAAVGALAGVGLFREASIAALTIIVVNVMLERAARANERR
jgi:putative Mg2+ transporter-C (MgtC) family protein